LFTTRITRNNALARNPVRIAREEGGR